MLNYSYKVFTEEDISNKYRNIYTQKSIEEVNFFDFRSKDLLYSERFYNNGLEYARRYWSSSSKQMPLLFKELRLLDYMNIQFVWNYYDIDGNNGGILECGCYKVIHDKFTLKLDFKIKLEHIYQMLLDMERDMRYLYNNKDINLYFYPLYVYNTVTEKYYRFSKYYQAVSHKFLYDEIHLMYASLIRFISLNAFAFNSYKSNNSFEYDVYGPDSIDNTTKHFIDTADVPYHELLSPAIAENKNVVVHLNVKDKIDLVIPKSTSCTRTKTKTKCQYQFEVKGHWHRYWVGPKDQKVLISKWVNPYIKGKDKKYKIVKQYEE